jgi:VWFA-related protein
MAPDLSLSHHTKHSLDEATLFDSKASQLPLRTRSRCVQRKTTIIFLASIASAGLTVGISDSVSLLDGQSTQQTPVSQSEAQYKISINSDLVVLPVTVKDRNGNLVAGLEQKDFHVFDDESEQTIDVFTSEATPLSLVLLIDDDLKSKDAAKMAPSLRAIAAGVSLADEATVCRFDILYYSGETFTSDGDRLLADLKNAQKASEPSKMGPVPFVTPPSTHPLAPGEPGPGPATDLGSAPTKALDDAVFASAQLLRGRGRTRRKVVLLISDGINGAVFNHHNYEETLNALLSDNISVYAVAVGSNSFHSKFALMRKYANDSGGDIYYATRSDQMEKLYSRITEQARYEYTLAYVPRVYGTSSNYHVVRVETTREGLLVETRRGYYASSATAVPVN